MATIDLTGGQSASVPAHRSAQRFVLERVIDCSDDGAASAGDTVDLFEIPANCLVEKVIAIVETAEGGTLTFDLGDEDTGDTFLNGGEGNSEAVLYGDGSTGTTTVFVQAYYAATKTATATIVNDADTAVIRVFYICQNLQELDS